MDLLNYFKLYAPLPEYHYMDTASIFRTSVSKLIFGRLNKNQIINFTNYIIHLSVLRMGNIHLLYLFLRHAQHKKVHKTSDILQIPNLSVYFEIFLVTSKRFLHWYWRLLAHSPCLLVQRSRIRLTLRLSPKSWTLWYRWA